MVVVGLKEDWVMGMVLVGLEDYWVWWMWV